MTGIYRFRWKKPAFLALTLSLLLTFSTVSLAFAAVQLTQISSDPYMNPTSNHKTQVEPDTFAFGNTIVSAFQSGRFFDGGASNIGFATSTNGGATWTHGFLPSSTIFATPAGIYQRASDASVAYDAKHQVWLISWLGIKNPSNGPAELLVSPSTDGGRTSCDPMVLSSYPSTIVLRRRSCLAYLPMAARTGARRSLPRNYSMTVIPAVFVLLPSPAPKLTRRAECTSSGQTAGLKTSAIQETMISC